MEQQFVYLNIAYFYMIEVPCHIAASIAGHTTFPQDSGKRIMNDMHINLDQPCKPVLPG